MDFMKKNKDILVKIIIYIFLLFIICLVIPLLDFIFNSHDEEEIHFLIFLATVALAIIAYNEFKRSHKLNSNEFLLFISNGWRSGEIIKARQILHEIFLKNYRNEKGESKSDYNQALFDMARDVLEISRKKDDKEKSFIYLLNLLDYLENMSYFYNRGDLDINDVQNTCGNNVIFFYEVFRLYIEQRQLYDKLSFSNYSLLYHKLKSVSIKKTMDNSDGSII